MTKRFSSANLFKPGTILFVSNNDKGFYALVEVDNWDIIQVTRIVRGQLLPFRFALNSGFVAQQTQFHGIAQFLLIEIEAGNRSMSIRSIPEHIRTQTFFKAVLEMGEKNAHMCAEVLPFTDLDILMERALTLTRNETVREISELKKRFKKSGGNDCNKWEDFWFALANSRLDVELITYIKKPDNLKALMDKEREYRGPALQQLYTCADQKGFVEEYATGNELFGALAIPILNQQALHRVLKELKKQLMRLTPETNNGMDLYTVKCKILEAVFNLETRCHKRVKFTPDEVEKMKSKGFDRGGNITNTDCGRHFSTRFLNQ